MSSDEDKMFPTFSTGDEWDFPPSEEWTAHPFEAITNDGSTSAPRSGAPTALSGKQVLRRTLCQHKYLRVKHNHLQNWSSLAPNDVVTVTIELTGVGDPPVTLATKSCEVQVDPSTFKTDEVYSQFAIYRPPKPGMLASKLLPLDALNQLLGYARGQASTDGTIYVEALQLEAGTEWRPAQMTICFWPDTETFSDIQPF
ncbi:hypothetical protein Q5752_005447 [Cryptotrichosporon argae]